MPKTNNILDIIKGHIETIDGIKRDLQTLSELPEILLLATIKGNKTTVRGGGKRGPKPGGKKRRKMSAAGRAKIAAAQRARWAKLKNK